MLRPSTHVEAFILDGQVHVRVYDSGELVAVVPLEVDQAIEVAADLLGTAQALKRQPARRERFQMFVLDES
jgi:hypothetical protein